MTHIVFWKYSTWLTELLSFFLRQRIFFNLFLSLSLSLSPSPSPYAIVSWPLSQPDTPCFYVPLITIKTGIKQWRPLQGQGEERGRHCSCLFPIDYLKSFRPKRDTTASCSLPKWGSNDSATMIDIPNPLTSSPNTHPYNCVFSISEQNIPFHMVQWSLYSNKHPS